MLSPSLRPARTALGRARGRHRWWLLGAAAGLVVATVGDAATGYDGPGPFIYPVVAVLLLVLPGRFTPLSATVVSVFFLAGGLTAPEFVARLVDPGRFGEFAAGWVQLFGFVVAAVAGVAAVRHHR